MSGDRILGQNFIGYWPKLAKHPCMQVSFYWQSWKHYGNDHVWAISCKVLTSWWLYMLFSDVLNQDFYKKIPHIFKHRARGHSGCEVSRTVWSFPLGVTDTRGSFVGIPRSGVCVGQAWYLKRKEAIAFVSYRRRVFALGSQLFIYSKNFIYAKVSWHVFEPLNIFFFWKLQLQCENGVLWQNDYFLTICHKLAIFHLFTFLLVSQYQLTRPNPVRLHYSHHYCRIPAWQVVVELAFGPKVL